MPIDEPCRHCAGTGVWNPRAPARDPDNGAVSWVTIEESCRMCVGTGRQTHEDCGLPAVR